MISKIPGVPPPIEKALPGSYVDRHLLTILGRWRFEKCSVPPMKLYNGAHDPTYHINQYKKRMMMAPVLLSGSSIY